MVRGWLLASALCVACSASDPCDDFPGLSCVTLEVRGSGAIDQIALHSLAGFAIADGRSPTTPRRILLPVQLPVLPGGQFAGPFELEVRGLLGGADVGTDRVHADIRAGEHLRLLASLRPSDGAVDLASSEVADLAGVDLAGIDLTGGEAALDLAGVDLAVPIGWQSENIPVSGPIRSIWGSSSRNVYAVTVGGAILHSSGGGIWTVQRNAATNETLFAITGSGAGDLWAGGGVLSCPTTCPPLLLHSTGDGSWIAVTVPAPTNKAPVIHAIAAASKLNVFLGIQGGDSDFLHTTDGSTWLPESVMVSRIPVDSIMLFAATNLFAATETGVVVQSAGAGSWTTVDTLTGFGSAWLFGTSGSDLYAAASSMTMNDSKVFHFAGSGKFAAQFDDDPQSADGDAVGITGSSATDLYAAFIFAIKHSSGDGHWLDESLPNFSEIDCVWAASDGQVFAGTDSDILHKR